jgi:hypothetical protein
MASFAMAFSSVESHGPKQERVREIADVRSTLLARKKDIHTESAGHDGRQKLIARVNSIAEQEIVDQLGAADVDDPQRAASLRALLDGLVESKLTSNTPLVASFKIDGETYAAVAYRIFEGDTTHPTSHPRLLFYKNYGRVWRRVTAAPAIDEFRDGSFFVSRIKVTDQHAVFFLIYGTYSDFDTGQRLLLRLYRYDGIDARVIWHRDDLTFGAVSVHNDRINLEFDREYRSNEPDNRVHEEFVVQPEKVLCLSITCE